MRKLSHLGGGDLDAGSCRSSAPSGRGLLSPVEVRVVRQVLQDDLATVEGATRPVLADFRRNRRCSMGFHFDVAGG